MSSRLAATLLAFVAFATTACEDELDFGFGDWEINEDTITLYTLARPELQGLPSGYDTMRPSARTVRVEDPGAAGAWDIALGGGVGGAPFELIPLGALLDIDSQAGIAVIEDRTFEELEIAPRDTAVYVRRSSVPVELGGVYVVRSRAVRTVGGGCVKFSKLQPLETDPAAGSLTFVVSGNPNCNDRALVPPED